MNEKCLPGLYPGHVISADCPESEKKVHKALKDDLPRRMNLSKGK